MICWNFKGLFETIGTNAQIADLIAAQVSPWIVSPVARDVSLWRHRNRVPAMWLPAFIRGAMSLSAVSVFSSRLDRGDGALAVPAAPNPGPMPPLPPGAEECVRACELEDVGL